MYRVYFLLFISAPFLISCASTGDANISTNGFLCIEKTIQESSHYDCLDDNSAKKSEVNERVDMYNAGKEKEEQIYCEKESSLGTKFTKWSCYSKSASQNGSNSYRRWNQLIRQGSF